MDIFRQPQNLKIIVDKNQVMWYTFSRIKKLSVDKILK